MTVMALSAPRQGSLRQAFRALLAAFGGFQEDVPEPFTSRAEIVALKGRDPDAWRELFEREHGAIYRYAASRLGDGHEAEDTTSQVFAHAWESAHLFEDRGLPVRAWLFGIARNVVNGHRRAWQRKAPALRLEDFDVPRHDPGLNDERIDLARAIAGLEAGWAEVITLRFIHGLSVQETGDVLGISIDAVKGKQARALAELRKKLHLDTSFS
ncbi:MAG: RNA polymerase sigma factor [Dehalococcoidia bacterium]